jgi:hypothetical protein
VKAENNERRVAEPKEDLPAEAVTALWEKNKVAAIRIVRQTHHIDLKAAKHKVDQYLSPATEAGFGSSGKLARPDSMAIYHRCASHRRLLLSGWFKVICPAPPQT